MLRTSFFAAIALALALSPAAARQRYGAQNWPTVGGGSSEAHYSTLTQITPGNVKKLGLAWSYDLGTSRVGEATPVVINGVLYTSANLGRVYAINAVTGKALWTFTPKVNMQANRSACCDQANRGVAVADGKVFVGALDGMLYALDQKTGKVVWKADTIVDHSRGYTSTGAPAVAGDVVLLGNGGAEYDTRGYVSAYNIKTGKLAWRFYTVPHDPAKGPQESKALQDIALPTWSKDSRWDIGGGGTPWDAIVYDKRFDTVYVGTGNGGPYSHAERSPGGGINLFLSSIIALDPHTGHLKWYYQETPKDSWDFTATQPMVLANLKVDGKVTPVIIHSPKNGFLFVIDRRTGKPLKIHQLVRQDWTSGYDMKTGKPTLTPESSDFSLGPKIIFPASAGARNWYPAAWDPKRKLYYASVIDMGNLMFMTPGPHKLERQALNTGAALIFTPNLLESLPTLPPPIRAQVEKLPALNWVKEKSYSSQLRAIDPITGKTRWAVNMEGWQDRSGVLATKAGLIFHGTIGGHFNVRDADTGKLLKSIDTGSAIMAGASTYEVNGTQYVAVQTGWGGGGWAFVAPYNAAYKYGNENRLLVFKLGGGKVQKPAPLPPLTVAPEPPKQAANVTPAVIGKGRGLFFAHCAICHSNQPRSISPNLHHIPPDVYAQFDNIVLGGLFLPGGMPRWDDLLTKNDAAAIKAYLIEAQHKTRAKELALKKAGKPLDAPAAAIMSNY